MTKSAGTRRVSLTSTLCFFHSEPVWKLYFRSMCQKGTRTSPEPAVMGRVPAPLLAFTQSAM